jgi:hypothetical protein
MSGLVWQKPYWGGCEKHKPVTDGTPWAQVRATTNLGEKVAKYHEDLSLGDIEGLEMSFSELDGLIREYKTRRFFYARSADGKTIGASRGEDTAYVTIVRQQIGHVHGYPTTADELIRFMRKYNLSQLAAFKQRFDL